LLLPALPFKLALSKVRAATSNANAEPPQLPSMPPFVETAEDRKKEDRRVAKWGRMLVPAVRDSGANIARWKFENRKERKLEVS
jgi:hypothetical protein